MGTNFFWNDQPCATCNRFEQVHVGKRSAGWSFGFHAYPHAASEHHSSWGYDPESPFGFPVMSRADWLKVFAERPGRLVDEYGRIEEDPTGWLAALVAPDAKQVAWEDAQRGTWPSQAFEDAFRNREWRDPEGFHFGAYEFS